MYGIVYELVTIQVLSKEAVLSLQTQAIEDASDARVQKDRRTTRLSIVQPHVLFRHKYFWLVR